MVGEITSINVNAEYDERGLNHTIDIYYEWNESVEGSVYLYWKLPSEESYREMSGGEVSPDEGYHIWLDLNFSGIIDFELYGQDSNGGTVFTTHFSLSITEPNSIEIPGTPEVWRGHKFIGVSWDLLEDATSYVGMLEDEGGDKQEKTNYRNGIEVFDVGPGEEDKVFIRAFVGRYDEINVETDGIVYTTAFFEEVNGPDCFGWGITASPSRPYISELGVVENSINFAWELEDPEPNITQVVFELYSSDGVLLEKITDYSGEWYGNGSFEADGDGDYYIRISANLNVNGTVLWALNDNAEKYYYKSKTITISNKKFFSWDAYNVNGHENFLKSGSCVRYLTKDAWNGLLDFMERNCYVEDFAIPNDSDVYGGCANVNYDVAINMCKMEENEGLLTSQIFNTVNYLVENMFGSAGIGLQYSKNPVCRVYASYFWEIQRVINEKILEE